MIRPNLVALDTVLWIARLGSFTAAAQQLHASQPAISMRVHELERSLGMQLFEKRGRVMTLTIEGRAFVDSMEPLLREVRDTLFSFVSPASAKGRIRIGMPEVAVEWFGHLMRELTMMMPGVAYELDIDIAAGVTEKLEDGRLDIAIKATDVAHPAFIVEPLGNSRICWVMAPDRLQRHGNGAEHATLSELINCGPLWLISRRSMFFQRQIDVLKSLGADLRNINTCTTSATQIEMIKVSGGLGFIAESLIAPCLANKSLVLASPDLPSWDGPYEIAYLRKQTDALVQRIVKLAVLHSGFIK